MKDEPKPTRASVLNAVIEEILLRQDGQIPTNIEGIDTFFDGTEDLANTLLLRWHTRLVASLERGLADEPNDARRQSSTLGGTPPGSTRACGGSSTSSRRTHRPQRLPTLSARQSATTGPPWPSRPGWPVGSMNQQFELAIVSSSRRGGGATSTNTARAANRNRERGSASSRQSSPSERSL
jgi:hypothetical protein